MALALPLQRSNVASVLILVQIVPYVSRAFEWWTGPAGAEADRKRVNWRGIALIVAFYAVLMAVFSLFP